MLEALKACEDLLRAGLLEAHYRRLHRASNSALASCMALQIDFGAPSFFLALCVRRTAPLSALGVLILCPQLLVALQVLGAQAKHSSNHSSERSRRVKALPRARKVEGSKAPAGSASQDCIITLIRGNRNPCTIRLNPTRTCSGCSKSKPDLVQPSCRLYVLIAPCADSHSLAIHNIFNVEASLPCGRAWESHPDVREAEQLESM